MFWVLHILAVLFLLPALFVTIPLHIIASKLDVNKERENFWGDFGNIFCVLFVIVFITASYSTEESTNLSMTLNDTNAKLTDVQLDAHRNMTKSEARERLTTAEFGQYRFLREYRNMTDSEAREILAEQAAATQ